MRTRLIISMLSVAMLGGAACKNAQEKSEDKFEKARENVREQSKDVRDEAKDVVKEPTSADERKDLAKEKRELGEANRDMNAAYMEFKTTTQERLTKLDGRINELEARGDAKSKETAVELRKEKNDIAARVDNMGDRASSNWEELKKDTDAKFDAIEKKLDDAF